MFVGYRIGSEHGYNEGYEDALNGFNAHEDQ